MHPAPKLTVINLTLGRLAAHLLLLNYYWSTI